MKQPNARPLERALVVLLASALPHWHRVRPSQALHAIPEPYPELREPPATSGKRIALPVLGGVQHDYRLAAQTLSPISEVAMLAAPIPDWEWQYSGTSRCFAPQGVRTLELASAGPHLVGMLESMAPLCRSMGFSRSTGRHPGISNQQSCIPTAQETKGRLARKRGNFFALRWELSMCVLGCPLLTSEFIH